MVNYGVTVMTILVLLPYMVIELHKYKFAENAEFEWVFKKMPGA